MSAETHGERAAPAPLPRGRHKLSRDEVIASQRSRLMQAMLDEVAARGYANVTLSGITRRARVARNTFYTLFEDKEDCFLAVCRIRGDELLRRLYETNAGDDWRAVLAAGMEGYLAYWEENPRFSFAYLVEVSAAGPRAQHESSVLHDHFAALFADLARRARHEEPSLPPLPARAPLMLVEAVTATVARAVREGHEDLAFLRDDLVWLCTNIVAGKQ